MHDPAPERQGNPGRRWLWTLPIGAIGALLAQVPPPLGFGTVALADGPCLGFLAESAGVADAPEITQHSGWRA
ncbi:MAG: hypothetical protein ACJ8AI_29095 [Rhodopila sp.]